MKNKLFEKMKIIIAPDKFKGSLTGLEFCDAVELGISQHCQNAEIVKLPLADGGDGTVEVLNHYLGGENVTVRVHDPLMRPMDANYLYSATKKMAFIEMAEASGIRLLQQNELNPQNTSTFGTGELIKNAIEKGAKHIILGIGGSSTNDAGMGMALALGFRFFDESGEQLEGYGKDLNKLKSIDSLNVLEELANVKFEIACDVDNPLFGKNGAAYIYSPQKGANLQMVEELDNGLKNFNSVVDTQFGVNLQNIKGAGAAGGLGAGCVLFLKAELKSGTSLIMDVANFEQNVKDADWIITGEGKFDEQTFSGKVIKGVIEARTNQKLAIFCGVSELDKSSLANHGVNYLAEMMSEAKDFNDSIENAGFYLKRAATEFAKQVL
jgi:glycerate kinase